jgi:DNA replication licensing factor MCM6
VREAYSLLRQSIIHVEKDDIDFDEEELESEQRKDRRGEDDVDVDTQLTAEELAQLEAAESAMSTTGLGTMSASATITSPSRVGGNAALLAQSSPARQQPRVPVPPSADAPPKRKMKITNDKYMTLQSLIVLHLSEHERNTGEGIEREDLVDWYLETKENDVANIEELEYEKELIGKILNKLVKVCHAPRFRLYWA